MSRQPAIPAELFRRWTNLWRAPDLAALLDPSDTKVDAHLAAKALARARINQSSLEAAFDEALGNGEFIACKILLEAAPATPSTGIPATLKATLEKRLEEARRVAQLEAEARRIELAVRASQVGLPDPDLSRLREVAARRKAEAEAIAAEVEAAIAAREAEVGTRLSARLDLAHPEDTTGSEAFDRWQETVGRLLESGRYQRALEMLDEGPAGRMIEGTGPHLIVRRPPFNFTESLPVTITNLLTDTSGRSYSPWRPAINDTKGRRLLEALGQIAEPGLQDKKAAVVFAAALQDALAEAELPSPQIQRYETGTCAFLQAFQDSFVPRLAACPDPGVPLWLPRSADALPPAELTYAPLVLAFHPAAPPADTNFVVSFDTELLCRIAGDPNRRVNFLRYVGSRIPASSVFPAGFSSAAWPPQRGAETTAWVLDLHNFITASSGTLDLIQYFTSGHRGLTAALLETLLSTVSFRNDPISPAHVRRAWTAPSFRAAAGRIIEESLGADPLIRATMFCLYFVAPRGEEVLPEDIEQWLREEFGYAGTRGVSEAVNTLVEKELFARGVEARTVCVPGPALVVLAQERTDDAFDRLVRVSLSGLSD